MVNGVLVAGKHSVVVRCHSIGCLRELDYCLFTLLGQTYRPLEVIIVCQSFDEFGLQELEELLEHYRGYPDLEFVAHNVRFDRSGDFRSCLLNRGIEAASGQFLSFLDYDDAMYPDAYEKLIRTLVGEAVAIAFGQIMMSHFEPGTPFWQYKDRQDDWFAGFRAKHQLFVKNFCPIHSFVLDRTGIDPADLYFVEHLTRFEDYHFLLRIVARYPSSLANMPQIIGEYVIKLDGSNTVIVHDQNVDSRRDEWAAMEAWLETEKKNIMITLSLQELNRMLHMEQEAYAEISAYVMYKERAEQAAREELATLLKSRSWRMTAPLRWAKQKADRWLRW